MIFVHSDQLIAMLFLSIQTNIVGTFNVCRLACKYLGMNDDKDGERGQIINVSSAAATEGQTGHVTLSAVSGAINSMTLPMARDLAPQSEF